MSEFSKSDSDLDSSDTSAFALLRQLKEGDLKFIRSYKDLLLGDESRLPVCIAGFSAFGITLATLADAMQSLKLAESILSEIDSRRMESKTPVKSADVVFFHAGKQTALENVGGKISDGMPKLSKNVSLSPPSVPPEDEHAPCQRDVRDFPCALPIPGDFSGALSTVWRLAKVDENGTKFLKYGSEDDVIFFMRTFLSDILLALKIDLSLNAEVTIKQIRPDLCVLHIGWYLVGVVEIKKPGSNVLLEPTVLGELLDQMLLVEGFYGMGPVIGILTTGEEWVMSWFPADTYKVSQTNENLASDNAWTTPLKEALQKEELASGATEVTRKYIVLRAARHRRNLEVLTRL